MTRDEAINMCKGIRHYLTSGNPVWDVEKVHEAMTIAIVDMEMIPKFQAQLSSKDTTLRRWLDEVEELLKYKKPEAKWTYYHNDSSGGYYGHPYCTRCGAYAPFKVSGEPLISSYCPDCGALMTEE